MSKAGKQLHMIVRESPKVGFLLAIGAIILFPMYMMITISLMTPAQLEKFPWFPVKMPVPESVNAPRSGQATIESPRLAVTAAGKETAISLPTDPRFYTYFVGIEATDEWKERSWQVAPDAAAGEATVAEYRAASVWTVQKMPDGEYLVDGAAFLPPTDFVSILPGLHVKADLLRELRVVGAASQDAKDALGRGRRATRAEDPVEKAQLEREAVLAEAKAEREIAQSRQAMARAETLAAKAKALRVTADEEMAEARLRLERAIVNHDRAREEIAPFAAKYEVEAKRLAALEEASAEDPNRFKVNRGEAVALLLATSPAQVSMTPGSLSVATTWSYELDAKRPFVVHPLVDKTGPDGREMVPDEPLATMVAARDMDLSWDGEVWTIDDGSALESWLPAGFIRLVEDGPEGRSDVRHLRAGQVVARANAPKVLWAAVGKDTMMVGLAVRPKEGGDFTIVAGDGRWVYSMKSDRETPFAVRLVGQAAKAEGATNGPLAAGSPLAELVVNRRRSITGTSDTGWAEAESGIKLVVPGGFVSRIESPASADKAETKTLADGTVLGTLAMPKATLIVDDEFIVVKMTESTWGSGEWEYPLGTLQTLQVARSATAAMSGGGPWTLKSTGDEGQGAIDAASAGMIPPDTIAEIRTSRKAILRYVDQQWTLDGKPVTKWYNEEILKRARQNFEKAKRTHDRFDRDSRDLELKARLAGSADEASRLREEAAAARAKAEGMAAELASTWDALVRAEKASGFIPLTGEDEPLSASQTEVVVEKGTVLARLRAEPDAEMEVAGWGLDTHVAEADGRLTVAFTHRLVIPARATVTVADNSRLSGGEPAYGYFTPRQFDVANYTEAWDYVKDYLLNTVVVAVSTMVLSLFFASLSAFIFSRFEFPGKAFFYAMIIVLLMIPGVLNLVPMYVIIKGLGLINPQRWINLLALILPAVAGGQVMNVYIMRNNLETLAKDLFDAARIDGASNLQTYRHIAIPLSKPIMGTLAILVLLSQWNNFIWPWIVCKEQKNMPVTAGLALLEGQNLSDYGLQMAGSVIASLPLVILFFIMMNLFIRGIQSGAIKA